MDLIVHVCVCEFLINKLKPLFYHFIEINFILNERQLKKERLIY